jgi:arylsulfatase A-like enzyme
MISPVKMADLPAILLLLTWLCGCGSGPESGGIIRFTEADRIANATSDRWEILHAFFPPTMDDEAYTKWDHTSSWHPFSVTEELGIKPIEGLNRGEQQDDAGEGLVIPPQTGVMRILPVKPDSQILVECRGTFGSPFRMRAQAVPLSAIPGSELSRGMIGKCIRTLGSGTVKLESKAGSDSARGVVFTSKHTKAVLLMVYSPRRFKGRLDWVRVADLSAEDKPEAAPTMESLVLDYALEKTLRPSLLLPVTTRIEFKQVAVPVDAIFRCAMGLPPGADPDIRVTINATESEGRLHRILEWTPLPGRTDWQEMTSDLDELAGRTVSFSVTAEGESSLSLALCGSPLITAQGEGPDLNVILVSLDTLRFDRLGCYGYEEDLSPNLDRLAREGVLFTNAYAHAAFTLPSHASLFTSLYPSLHGAEDMTGVQKLPENVELMARILARNGMNTASFNGGGLISHEFGFHRGFDLYCEKDPLADRFFQGAGEGSFGQALQWIEEMRDEAFFLFLHTYMVHDYLPPPDVAKAFEEKLPPSYEISRKTLETIRQKHYHGDGMSGDDLAYLEVMYNATIVAADRMMGELLDHLESMGLEDRTLIIVTSDHGEEFLEHEGILHGFTLYEEMIHVPLIIKGPGMKQGVKAISAVGQVDILPTILDLLGVEEDVFLAGRSLAPLLQGRDLEARPVYAEVNIPNSSLRRCFIEEGWKYIEGDTDPKLKIPAPAREELFMLNRDPLEKSNLHTRDRERSDRLRSRLKGMRKGLDQLKERLKIEQGEVNTISPELKEQLHQQGYL